MEIYIDEVFNIPTIFGYTSKVSFFINTFRFFLDLLTSKVNKNLQVLSTISEFIVGANENSTDFDFPLPFGGLNYTQCRQVHCKFLQNTSIFP